MLLPHELGVLRRAPNNNGNAPLRRKGWHRGNADVCRVRGVLALDPCEDVLGVDMDAGAEDRVDQALHLGDGGEDWCVATASASRIPGLFDWLLFFHQSWYTTAVLRGGLDGLAQFAEVGLRFGVGTRSLHTAAFGAGAGEALECVARPGSPS